MRARLLAAAVLVALAGPAAARHRHGPRVPPATVVLNGEEALVRWTDGDTFRILRGPFQGRSARLQGYNTLETFGPVHRWGGWVPAELLALAKAAGPVAAAGRWSCTSAGAEDRYRRLLVACPAAAAELVRRGLAMVYAVEGPPDPALLGLQREAQRDGRGIWRKGVPRGIVTSVHSAAENVAGGAYDRVVDTASGAAAGWPHATVYATCQEVCREVDGSRSCMRYVPFERRYRHRPWCLRR